jgi:adenosylcobinamide-phosphate synthase
LDEARRLAGYHLVSRPTDGLDAGQMASATVESAGESLTDGFVAPLLCYLIFVLAGAYAYRAISTADAMFGFREGPLEYFGKISARLDDIANWIPSRVAALSIVGAAAIVREDAPGSWRTLVRDRRRTASPNAGWTMSALAGALGVGLEKPGLYCLGDGPRPRTVDIERGIRVVFAAAMATTAMAIGWLALRRGCRG